MFCIKKTGDPHRETEVTVKQEQFIIKQEQLFGEHRTLQKRNIFNKSNK